MHLLWAAGNSGREGPSLYPTYWLPWAQESNLRLQGDPTTLERLQHYWKQV